jgi:hypothetical protein
LQRSVFQQRFRVRPFGTAKIEDVAAFLVNRNALSRQFVDDLNAGRDRRSLPSQRRAIQTLG